MRTFALITLLVCGAALVAGYEQHIRSMDDLKTGINRDALNSGLDSLHTVAKNVIPQFDAHMNAHRRRVDLSSFGVLCQTTVDAISEAWDGASGDLEAMVSDTTVQTEAEWVTTTEAFCGATGAGATLLQSIVLVGTACSADFWGLEIENGTQNVGDLVKEVAGLTITVCHKNDADEFCWPNVRVSNIFGTEISHNGEPDTVTAEFLDGYCNQCVVETLFLAAALVANNDGIDAAEQAFFEDIFVKLVIGCIKVDGEYCLVTIDDYETKLAALCPAGQSMCGAAWTDVCTELCLPKLRNTALLLDQTEFGNKIPDVGPFCVQNGDGNFCMAVIAEIDENMGPVDAACGFEEGSEPDLTVCSTGCASAFETAIGSMGCCQDMMWEFGRIGGGEEAAAFEAIARPYIRDVCGVEDPGVCTPSVATVEVSLSNLRQAWIDSNAVVLKAMIKKALQAKAGTTEDGVVVEDPVRRADGTATFTAHVNLANSAVVSDFTSNNQLDMPGTQEAGLDAREDITKGVEAVQSTPTVVSGSSPSSTAPPATEAADSAAAIVPTFLALVFAAIVVLM